MMVYIGQHPLWELYDSADCLLDLEFKGSFFFFFFLRGIQAKWVTFSRLVVETDWLHTPSLCFRLFSVDKELLLRVVNEHLESTVTVLRKNSECDDRGAGKQRTFQAALRPAARSRCEKQKSLLQYMKIHLCFFQCKFSITTIVSTGILQLM